MESFELDEYHQQVGYTEQVNNYLDTLWAELNPYKDSCYFIYAGLHAQYTILLRSDEHVLMQIKDATLAGKRNVIFDCTTEGLDIRIISKLNSIVDAAKKLYPDVDFFLITAASDSEDAYIKACEQLQVTPVMHLISCRFFEFKAKAECNKDLFPTEYIVNTRPKTYVCLNKVIRSHRIRLLEGLLAANLVNDDCYYSFHNPLLSLKDDQSLQEEITAGHLPNIQKNSEYVDTLILNFDDTRTNPIDIIADDLPLFNDSYFSLVTETMYYDWTVPKYKLGYPLPYLNCIFFSEKVYKPIVMMQPFILVGRPHSIRMLKEHGYKTFHPYIDESYDSIEDDGYRMQVIIDEVKRLSEQSSEEWLLWCTNIKSIVEHNQKHFYENTSYIVHKDLSSLT